MYEDVKAAYKMMANLSDLLHITLNAIEGQEQPLDQELEIVGLYLKIMNARYQDKMTMSVNVDEDTGAAMVPRFIRIHRSTIVNKDFIRELQPWSHGDYIAILENGERLNISRRYKDRLFNKGYK